MDSAALGRCWGHLRMVKMLLDRADPALVSNPADVGCLAQTKNLEKKSSI